CVRVFRGLVTEKKRGRKREYIGPRSSRQLSHFSFLFSSSLFSSSPPDRRVFSALTPCGSEAARSTQTHTHTPTHTHTHTSRPTHTHTRSATHTPHRHTHTDPNQNTDTQARTHTPVGSFSEVCEPRVSLLTR